jgi:DNA (cytosine-5)-methyltransferase 1
MQPAWLHGVCAPKKTFKHAYPAKVILSRMRAMPKQSVLELCAGAGGQALGFEQAGFRHAALVEIDKHACETLRRNRPAWNVIETDLHDFDSRPFAGTDIVAAGLPCPPFSKAGRQLGHQDERNLFPVALKTIAVVKPRAVIIENVRGLLDDIFEDYRTYISGEMETLGYWTDWRLLNASDFGVPQLRPRVVFVAIRKGLEGTFEWPAPGQNQPQSVGEVLYDLMAANGWRGAAAWKKRACEIAPTIVGGSKKHGGPDLGPTRAKRAWAALGVNGHLLAVEAPQRNFLGMPHLTVRMVAKLQGFPDEWQFSGAKTAAYRQVGNAFPPPVARAVAESVLTCLQAEPKLKLMKAAG